MTNTQDSAGLSSSPITVLIPAHNEADRVGATIDSLRRQDVQPDRIVVVSDNSSDDTVAVALGRNVEVFETAGNEHKKAGALNQALAAIDPVGYVLVMDADTILADGWISTAVALLDTDATLGAVGAVFYGDRQDSLLTQLQSNEYTRYGREIDRTGRVMVLSGTAALIRAHALRQIAEARANGKLHGRNPEDMPREMTAEQREVHFWSKFEQDSDGCLVWTGRKNEDGYGGFDVPSRRGRNRSVLTHRQAWEYLYGPIPEGLQVLHHCDNPVCAAAAHMFLGTHDDNMRDKAEKNRVFRPRGSRNGRAKLTQEDVNEIRSSYTGAYGQKADLARRYGLSKTTIAHIIAGKLWPERKEVVSPSVEQGVYDVHALTED